MPIKLFISQPMRGREYDDIIRERKQMIADAAVALQTDDIRPLETLHRNGKTKPLAMLGRNIEQMAEADAVIFAAGWRDARGCRCERMIAAEYGLRILDAQPRG